MILKYDMTAIQFLGRVLGLLLISMACACGDFVDIEPPSDQLTGSAVFENGETVDAALGHIYAELRGSGFSNGGVSGISYLMGHYTDELELFSLNLPSVQGFGQNDVLPSNSYVEGLWDSSYTLIHHVNSIIEGVNASSTLGDEVREQYLAEAHFLRAYIHFNLVNLFGEVPYLQGSDYRTNRDASRMDVESVHQSIIADLEMARDLMPISFESPDRFRPDHWTIRLMLARAFQQSGDWEGAAFEAEQVITDSGYLLNPDIETVFLKESVETLWQLDVELAGNNAREASTFVVLDTPPSNSALSDFLMDDFEAGDLRREHWVGEISNGTDTWFFPYKYKGYLPTDTTMECSILFRFSEALLIAAEARAQLGQLGTALQYLNAVRQRAGLPILETMPKEDLLGSIYRERRVEFFSEQGHRFLDLKRSGRLDEALGPIKSNWNSTDSILPIPEDELLLNPNLLPQNEGY
jgi:hypothetical protein